jgi:hypothetical protein
VGSREWGEAGIHGQYKSWSARQHWRNRRPVLAYPHVVDQARSQREDAAETRPHNRRAHSVAQGQKPQTRQLDRSSSDKLVTSPGRGVESRFALSLLPTPYRNGFEALTLAANVDQAVLRFVVEDHGRLAFLGLREDFDAVLAGRFGVGIDAGDEVGV